MQTEKRGNEPVYIFDDKTSLKYSIFLLAKEICIYASGNAYSFVHKCLYFYVRTAAFRHEDISIISTNNSNRHFLQ